MMEAGFTREMFGDIIRQAVNPRLKYVCSRCYEVGHGSFRCPSHTMTNYLATQSLSDQHKRLLGTLTDCLVRIDNDSVQLRRSLKAAIVSHTRQITNPIRVAAVARLDTVDV